VCHIIQVIACTMFFEEISATLQLGTGPFLLPRTDRVTAQAAGCAFNSMMRNEKRSVASYRQGWSVTDVTALWVA
jgi:hypothetical protein